MALIYTCENQVIEMALDRLKDDGLVSREAFFNYDAPHNLRREVAYRDFDFLSRLCRVGEVESVRSILAWLKREGVVPESATYNEGAFEALRREVKKFTFPGTSITPVMERLLYALSWVRRPRRVIGIGTYCGNALVWCVGASCGPGRVYEAQKVYGIDIDARGTEQARENLGKLAHTEHIELITEDGLEAVERLEGPFDYVFLDAESKELGKSVYLELLKRLYGKVEKGGWVLAHDTAVPPFAGQLEGYLAFVRDGENFKESIAFDVDPFGLELSVK
ncbi:MAG: class I SAM-dependent methyltransferase [Anaerolineae bacterium]|jgi:predicted O-methyltransferase YrrM